MSILKSDKWNASVILDPTEYQNKMMVILQGDDFQKIPMDLIGRIERTVIKLLWPDTVKDVLVPIASVPPRIFRLPKIHKESCPLCPIVNMIGSPTYNGF